MADWSSIGLIASGGLNIAQMALGMWKSRQQAQLTELKERVETLERDNEELKATKKALSDLVAEGQKQLQDMRDEKRMLETQLGIRAEEKLKLEREIAALKNRVEDLEQKSR